MHTLLLVKSEIYSNREFKQLIPEPVKSRFSFFLYIFFLFLFFFEIPYNNIKKKKHTYTHTHTYIEHKYFQTVE